MAIYDFRKEDNCGYTTGSCVCAGAYAGIYYLKNNIKLDYVEIENDNGDKLIIPIENITKKNKNTVIAHVKKFSGKDIDITNRLDIYVEVKLFNNDKINNYKNSGTINDTNNKNNNGNIYNKNINEDNNKNKNNYINKIYNKIKIIGGKGVGIVTKDGLQIKKGNYAINPKPKELIIKNIKKLLNNDESVVIKIIIPKGEELAKKTLNPKLGIVGGLSILGTTGIVRPMSNEAYKKSLEPQIDIALHKNYDYLVYTPGNIGTKYSKKLLNVEDDQIVEVSNFWDYMLDKSEEKGVKKILIFGHSGKLVKLAGGIYNTHSKVSDGRNEIICSYTSIIDNNKELLKKILFANTTEEITNILEKRGLLNEVFNLIAKRVVERAENRWKSIKFSCIIINMKGDILGKFNTFSYCQDL